MLHSLCCWSAQQQSPPSSPISPSNGQSATECSCSSTHHNLPSTTTANHSNNNEKTVTTTNTAATDCHLHQQELVNNNNNNTNYASLEKQGFEGPLKNTPSRPSSPSHHQRRQSTNNNNNNSIHGSLASLHSVSSNRSTSSRSNYLRGFLSSSRRNSPVSTPPLTPAAVAQSPAPANNTHGSDLNDSQQQHSSPGKSPTKFSLQKFYYPRNSMTTTQSPSSPSNMQTPALTSSSPSTSIQGSFSKLDTGTARQHMSSGFEGPRALGLIPPPPPVAAMATSAPLQPAPSIPQPPPLSLTVSDFTPTAIAPLRMTGVPILTLPTLAPPRSVTPTLTTILPSPTTPSAESNMSDSTSIHPNSSLSPHPFALSTLSSSYSTSSSASYTSGGSSPNTSPSTSPTDTTSNSHILSPAPSELTPYPARGLSPARLAAMLEKGAANGQGARSRPLLLDLRPLPDFEPASIVHSININLPTLLMRRYRKGGAVSSFALESFITIPSDKDLYHLIQDGWRQDRDIHGNETTVRDIVVLDHEMRSGQEEYGRSASPAWTVVSVLERGGGNCGGNGPIQLWFLEGGFEAFQAWDASEKYIRRPGSEFGNSGHQDDVEMAHAELESGDLHPLSMPLSLSRSTTSSTMTDAKTAQAIDNAVSLTNASLGGTPRQRGPPARRESLFSLNTKSLPRPAGLSRAQTIGVSALNIKPLSIPSTNNPSLQPLQEGASLVSVPQLPPLRNKGSWLTVPTGGATSLSPSLSLNVHHANSSGHPLDMSHSNTTDPALTWSANSGVSTVGGDPQHPLALTMGSKKSFSSTTTTLTSLYPCGGGAGKGIQEEEEEESADGVRRKALRDDMPPPTPSGFGPTSSFFDLSVNPAKGGGPLDMGESRMFSEGIESFTNNPSYRSPFQYPQQQQQFQYGYDDDSMADGGDDGEQEISCILPEFLYLGPEIVTAEQVQELERLGVKRVLNMARECEDLLIVNHPTIEYHKVGVLDNIEADVSTGLLEAVDIIAASADSPIYVHCKAGKSRSVTATIAYLITQLQWSLNKAYNHVLTQRPCMCPNIGFVTELMRMEERILGNDRSGGLVRAGSLNSILSLSTAGSGAGHNQHHHQHHSLQHHHSLSMGGSPKVLSTKASVNSFAMMSPLHHGGI